jgi:hypothetical protein
VVGRKCIQLWAAQNAQDPRCGVCRGVLYDDANYVPDPCRRCFRAVKKSLGAFKTLSEDVDDWLAVGVEHGEAYTQFGELVGKLEICVLDVKEEMDGLIARAEDCRPNFAVMGLCKVYGEVKETYGLWLL